MKTLQHVATEKALHVLAYNLKRVPPPPNSAPRFSHSLFGKADIGDVTHGVC